MAQNFSNGPAAHWPSLPVTQLPPGHSEAPVQLRNALQPPTHVMVGEQVESLQSFGFVG